MLISPATIIPLKLTITSSFQFCISLNKALHSVMVHMFIECLKHWNDLLHYISYDFN